MRQPVVIGIDVSKASVTIAVHPSGERWTSETTPTAIDSLVARLQTSHPELIVMEATAGYELPLAAACAAVTLPVAIVNPRQVRAFAQAAGRTAKTDESMPACWRSSARACIRRRGRFPMRRPRPCRAW